MMNNYHKVVKFDNGYRASIISNKMSYGGDVGLFEIAIVNQDNTIAYDTPLTDDVFSNLDFEGVVEVLKEIKALPAREKVS